LNTEMPLRSSDIVRIRGLGFSDDFFIVKRNGERRLRNSMGRCVFQNGQLCTIYNDRPEGCRIYPVILDVYKEKAVLDGDCPYHRKFQVTPSISREVIKLVQELSRERDRRLRSRAHMMGERYCKTQVVRLIREGRPEDALALLAEEYGVRPPKLLVGTVKGRRRVAGCYVAKEGTIYLSNAEMMFNPYVVLHEFYHHLRSIEGKFSGSEKHAERFAREFLKFHSS